MEEGITGDILRLKDKSAVITGGAGDIGRAIALRFAEEGADVAVMDLSLMAAESVTEKIKAMGRKALAFEGDVTNGPAMEHLFSQIVSAWGKIDILVSNAGVRRDAPLQALQESEWEAVIDVHLKGCFHCVKAAGKYMAERQQGKIIILASPVPPDLGRPGSSSYSAANAGLMGFTASLAIELGPYSIHVNAIAPDFIQTRMTRESIKKEGMFLEDFKKAALAHIPLRRLGTVEDVSRVALFLASEESDFVTGQVIKVRGGP
ncbi:MAG: SDR family NAD(P)-dependent oxidoreductase [Thermodesulfobacteriota bacterium]